MCFSKGSNLQSTALLQHCQGEYLANICDMDFFNTIDPLRSLKHERFNACFC